MACARPRHLRWQWTRAGTAAPPSRTAPRPEPATLAPRGEAWRGVARRGEAWRGVARRGATAGRFPTCGTDICVAGMPSEVAHEVTIGMNIAQTGVLFIKAEIASTGSSRRTMAHMWPRGLPSSTRASSSRPPVHCTPLATAHITPTATTPSELNPSSTSFSPSTPVRQRTTDDSRSTWSGGMSKAIWSSATTSTAAVIPALRGRRRSIGASRARTAAVLSTSALCSPHTPLTVPVVAVTAFVGSANRASCSGERTRRGAVGFILATREECETSDRAARSAAWGVTVRNHSGRGKKVSCPVRRKRSIFTLRASHDFPLTVSATRALPTPPAHHLTTSLTTHRVDTSALRAGGGCP